MYWKATVAALTVALFIGCGPAKQPEEKLPGTTVHDDDHEHAKTFDGAVEELAQLNDEIRDAFAKEDPGTAHDPLHDVVAVLDNLEKFAKSLDAKDNAAAKGAIDELFAAFDKVDKQFHGEDGADYADVSVQIDAAMGTLAGIVSASAEKAPKTTDGDDNTSEDTKAAPPAEK